MMDCVLYVCPPSFDHVTSFTTFGWPSELITCCPSAETAKNHISKPSLWRVELQVAPPSVDLYSPDL